MHSSIILSLFSLSALALAKPNPVQNSPSRVNLKRQEACGTLPPCTPIVPAPTEEETKIRHDEFAQAFIVDLNITNAFAYISSVYIVGYLYFFQNYFLEMIEKRIGFLYER